MTKISGEDPTSMTNGMIVKEYEEIGSRESRINDELIKDGFGWVRPSDMRKLPSMHELIPDMLALADRKAALWREATHRYGPGLISISHLRCLRRRMSQR